MRRMGDRDRPYLEVENLAGNHHSEELFRRSWEGITNGLANGQGDFGDSSQLFPGLLFDLVGTGDRHGIEQR